MRLCGLEADAAFVDTTYLHFSGLADNRRSRWDPQLCKLLGIDAAKLWWAKYGSPGSGKADRAHHHSQGTGPNRSGFIYARRTVQG